MKIIVASDSFKDSLSSAEVASALRAGIMSADPEAEVVGLSVGDGGEGTASVLVESLGGEWKACLVSDPLGRLIDARYGVVGPDDKRIALIEMAASGGLQLLRPEERNVMQTSSVGLGEMILDAYEEGCREFIIGIGGSATCDAGMGMLSALGFRFLDSEDKTLKPVGESLVKVSKIDTRNARRDITDCRFTIVCDVSNPLYGPDGAAVVFGPQKGASPEDVDRLDRGLRNFSDIIIRTIGRDMAEAEGAGASGGLGMAFVSFFNSELTPGVEAVLNLVGFDKILQGADLVITGEGRMDSQTLFGKLPFGVCRRAKNAGIPVVAITGSVDSVESLLDAGFDGIFPIPARPMSLAEALKPEVAKKNIEITGQSLARFLKTIKNTKYNEN